MLSAATTSFANNANTLFPHRDDCEAGTGYVLPPLSADSEPGGTFQTSVSWGSVPSLGIGARVTIVPPTPTQASASVGCWRVAQRGSMALARLAEQLGAPTMASQRRRPLSAAAEMAVIRRVAVEVVGQEPLGSVAAHSTLHQSLQAAHLPISHRDQTPMARQGC